MKLDDIDVQVDCEGCDKKNVWIDKRVDGPYCGRCASRKRLGYSVPNDSKKS